MEILLGKQYTTGRFAPSTGSIGIHTTSKCWNWNYESIIHSSGRECWMLMEMIKESWTA